MPFGRHVRSFSVLLLPAMNFEGISLVFGAVTIAMPFELAGDSGLATYFGAAAAATAIHFVAILEPLLNFMAKAEAPTVPNCLLKKESR